MPPEVLPFSVVIPTRNRASALRRTLESLAKQQCQPHEVIIIDASGDGLTRSLCEEEPIPGLRSKMRWLPAEAPGAASQRNQGVQFCSQDVIGYIDDDILFEPMCIANLWHALQSDPHLGGVNAMITNQRYHSPGPMSSLVFRLMAGRRERSYAGRVLGPAVNLLPEDGEDLPEIVQVDWLNTTCCLYWRKVLPNPPFPQHFTGYSLMEDLTLSLIVGKSWKLVNSRIARIYHDSQPGAHKENPRLLSAMELVNRHYVMTEILGRNGWRDYLKLAFFELFSVASTVRANPEIRTLGANIVGKLEGVRQLCLSRSRLSAH